MHTVRRNPTRLQQFGDIVVSDVQPYLDLVSYEGRGEEATVYILEQRVRSLW